MNEWAQSPEESIKMLKIKSDDEEIAAEIYELNMKNIDTQELVNTIMSTLKDAKINQANFATEVMGISVSQLRNQLYHPMPWAQCGVEAKKQFLKMYNWIRLSGSLETLKALASKNENNIDTFKLTDEIRKMLKEAKIMRRVFAKEVLGISCLALNSMINEPQEWSQCSDERKRRYQKMNEWIKSPATSIISLKKLSAKKHKDDVDHYENIDTFKLANEIKNKLNEENIPYCQFAKNVLGIQTIHFYRMLSRPMPYSLCRSHTKELYRKMHDWSQTPEESIESIKMLTNKIKVMANKFEGEVELDIPDLVERVKKLLARKRISKNKISVILDMYDGSLKNLLEHPMPWNSLNKVRKNYYTKIHAWLIENEEQNESDERLSESMLENNETDTINTTQVAGEFVQLLKINGISHGYFARRQLSILLDYFEQLVNKPKPYADLIESDKKIFQCMKKWTEPGEAENLKRDYDAFVSMRQTFYQNRNQKRKKLET
jgi:hypothetical protein